MNECGFGDGVSVKYYFHYYIRVFEWFDMFPSRKMVENMILAFESIIWRKNLQQKACLWEKDSGLKKAHMLNFITSKNQ